MPGTMAWPFTRQRAAVGGTEADPDAEILREGLLTALTALASDASPADRSRLERIAERVRRPPAPTGLARKLEQVLAPRLRGREAGDLHELAVALARLAAKVAIDDEALAEGLRRLRRAVARGIESSQRPAIFERLRAVEQAASPARQRFEAANREMLTLVEEIGRHLESVGGSSARMSGHLGEMARALAEARDAEGLRRLRSRMGGIIAAMQAENEQLRGALEAALERAARMESAARQRAAERDEAVRQGFQDALTGALNRAWFDKELPRFVAGHQERGAPASLALLDLDHFKEINDSLGHPAGDAVLQAVVRAVGRTIRERDALARVGGEEFALLLPGTGAEGALRVAERVRAAVSEAPITVDGRTLWVTCSAGVAEVLPDDTPESLYKRADTALYQAKSAGRNAARLAA